MFFDARLVQELLALRSRLREVIERAQSTPAGADPWPEPGRLEPAVDVWESATEILVEVELPGARPADVNLRLEGNELVVAGLLPSETDEGARYLRMERPRGAFSRHIPIPVEVAGDPRATLRSGVLRVRIPKAAAPARRTIAVTKEGP